jgi:hypothetical protein
MNSKNDWKIENGSENSTQTEEQQIWSEFFGWALGPKENKKASKNKKVDLEKQKSLKSL